MKKLLLSSSLFMLCLSCSSQVSFYKGEWTKVNNQTNFSGILKLEIKDTVVTADILWTYIAVDSSDETSLKYYKDKRGKMGMEYTRGSYSPTTHDIIFQGISKTDPYLIIGLDKYILKLSLNKKVIYGLTYSNGDKDGLAYFIQNTDPTLSKTFDAIKANLLKRNQDNALR